MTLEEAQAKLAEMTKAQEADKATIKQLNDNISKQNSYITKLEGKTNSTTESAQKVTNPQVNNFDPTVQAYLEKNMKRDTIDEARKQILQEVSKEMYDAVEPDFITFLEKNMKKENCTVDYAVDAFSLVMGRALRNKEHAINQIGKGTTPPATPNPVVQPTTNSSNVQAVQNTILNTPPIMSNKDVGAGTGAPDSSIKVNNTKDAFKSLKDRFTNIGGNKFN